MSCASLDSDKVWYQSSYFRILLSSLYGIFFIFIFFFRLFSETITSSSLLKLYVRLSGLMVSSVILLSSTFVHRNVSHLFNHVLHSEETFYISNIKSVNSVSLKYFSVCLVFFIASFVIDNVYFFREDILFSCFSTYAFPLYNLLVIILFSVGLFWLNRTIKKLKTLLSSALVIVYHGADMNVLQPDKMKIKFKVMPLIF